MKIEVPKGKYIFALSGGVDSVSLLDLLTHKPGINIIIGHFNHGIREDSAQDEEVGRDLARKYELQLEIGYGKLGPQASEEMARNARYRFLKKLQKKYDADAIITAHHQDDLIETAFLNLLRGSGRRGMSAISSSDILRPLLSVPKKTIIEYAKQQGLHWREDSTNRDSIYLRNYLRQEVLSKLTMSDRRELVHNLKRLKTTNHLLDKQIATLSHKIKKEDKIMRSAFAQLPSEIANELMVFWLRQLGFLQFDKNAVNRLSLAIKTGLAGTKQAVHKGLWLEIGLKNAHFTTTD